jgi:hypothetical protein
LSRYCRPRFRGAFDDTIIFNPWHDLSSASGKRRHRQTTQAATRLFRAFRRGLVYGIASATEAPSRAVMILQYELLDVLLAGLLLGIAGTAYSALRAPTVVPGLPDHRLVVGPVIDHAGLEQLALAGDRQLLPCRRHLFQLLAMRRRGGTRHFPAFGSVLAVFVQFSHATTLPPPAYI